MTWFRYGPLHSKVGTQGYLKTLEDAKAAGGRIEYGGQVISREGGYKYLQMCRY